MGVDLHNLNFLAHAQDLGVSFEHTLAIGRQAVFIEARELRAYQRLRRLPPLASAAVSPLPGAPFYAEPLLQRWFGALRVDSVDASAYENASLIHDMNLPWPADGVQRGSFDAVLDFGCLEHVFDFPTAWRNVVDLCRVGGHVLHALPANNLAGHGFYQFSPELFFNLYQPARGFELRGLFFAMKAEPRYWWKVASPLERRRRVNLCNGHEVYMLVLARKLRDPGGLPAPQQSDYALVDWQAAPPSANKSAATAGRNHWSAPLAALGLLDVARRWRERRRALGGAALKLPAADYERVEVAGLLQRPATP